MRGMACVVRVDLQMDWIRSKLLIQMLEFTQSALEGRCFNRILELELSIKVDFINLVALQSIAFESSKE